MPLNKYHINTVKTLYYPKIKLNGNDIYFIVVEYESKKNVKITKIHNFAIYF